jgi:hypothetical protein
MSNWVTALLSPIQYIQKMLYRFVHGSTDLEFNILTSYSFGTFIKYQNKVYLKWTYGSNTTNNPNVDTANWYKVMDGIFGIEVKKNWYPGRLTLEYILNTFFSTTYNNPIDGTSDIYITNPLRGDVYFTSYASPIGSQVYKLPANSLSAVYDGAININSIISFTINVPTATHIALGSDPDEKIKSVIKDYVYAGINYSVTTY